MSTYTATSASSNVLPIAMMLASAGAAAGGYYLFSRNYNKSNLLYFLYSRTPVGKVFHRANLASNANKLQSTSTANTATVGYPLIKMHSTSRSSYTFESPKALVRIVPFLSDNYAYILVCKNTGKAAVVDPADAAVVAQAVDNLEQEIGQDRPPLQVTTVLTTHYHQDHAGGNNDFIKIASKHKNLEIVGGANEQWPGVEAATKLVKHGDQLKVGDLTVTCLDVPCHTWGSVLFLVEGEKLCFTGDFLFSAGCGRFFEGGANDFCGSLARSVNSRLDDDVLMFPGHEYTISNLKFAAKIMPDDEDIQQALEKAQEQRTQGDPTIPSKLGLERKINLFLRAGDPRLSSSALVQQIKRAAMEGKQPLTVSSGADKHDPSTFHIKIHQDETDVVPLVRALRALKDRG